MAHKMEKKDKGMNEKYHSQIILRINYLTNRIERQQCFGRIDWPGFKKKETSG